MGKTTHVKVLSGSHHNPHKPQENWNPAQVSQRYLTFVCSKHNEAYLVTIVLVKVHREARGSISTLR